MSMLERRAVTAQLLRSRGTIALLLVDARVAIAGGTPGAGFRPCATS